MVIIFCYLSSNNSGQTFIVVQQQTNTNNAPPLSPHYVNASGVMTTNETGQPFLQINWPQNDERNGDSVNIYSKNTNGITEKSNTNNNNNANNSNNNGRRTPYSNESQNGMTYHQYYGMTTPDSNFANSDANTNSNGSSSNQFIPTTTYSTNQSQSFTSPTQDYRDSNASSSPRLQNQEGFTNSRNSPGRMAVSKTIDNNDVSSGNGVNSTVQNQSEESTESFLVNTTTTMHQDLTTSMSTSTGNLFNSY